MNFNDKEHEKLGLELIKIYGHAQVLGVLRNFHVEETGLWMAIIFSILVEFGKIKKAW